MTETTPKKPYRVLSLDGGGMRGLYTASVLQTLAKRFGENLDAGKGFDLIVGTSTGSILATGLAAGIPLSKIIKLYRDIGPKIFTDQFPSKPLSKLLWATRNICKPANSDQALKNVLHSIYGDESIGKLYQRRKIALCIPTVNIATHKAQIFKTPHVKHKNADDDRMLVEICLASSAAPIILPIATINDPHTSQAHSYYADGGLWANNPILVSLVEALETSEEDQPIEIVSIGSCPPPSGSAITRKEAQRGLFGWKFGIKALELSMDAQAFGHQSTATFLARHLNRLGRNINILRLPQSSPSSDQAEFLGLDGTSENACTTLIQLANSDALQIYGRATSPHDELQTLLSIFNSMPVINEETI